MSELPPHSVHTPLVHPQPKCSLLSTFGAEINHRADKIFGQIGKKICIFVGRPRFFSLRGFWRRTINGKNMEIGTKKREWEQRGEHSGIVGNGRSSARSSHCWAAGGPFFNAKSFSVIKRFLFERNGSLVGHKNGPMPQHQAGILLQFSLLIRR